MGLRPTDFLIDDDSDTTELCSPVVLGRPKGRGYVPRDYSVDPPQMFAPPSEMSLIPESEWSARIKEMEQTQSSLSHMRGMIPSLDQGQVGYCATADTEILTSKGFVPWPEYNWSDPLGTVSPGTEMLEFQHPLQRHVYEYNGDMVYSTNRRVDFGMTPDHRMLVRKWDEQQRTLSDQYTFQKAGELGWYVGLMAAPRGCLGTDLIELGVEGDRTYDGDDFLALLALIVSDGYAGGTDNTRNWVSFCCFDQDRYATVNALAQRVGFHEVPSRKGVWIRYDAPALAQWVRTHCYSGETLGATNKKIPDVVRVASTRQIKHFLKFYGDQDHGGKRQHYYSSSKPVVDGLQELFLRIGQRSTISERAARQAIRQDGVVIRSSESWELHVGQTDRLCLERKNHIEHAPYKGLVYCATVPNGTLITRRNGTVLISGNCWAHSTTHATMLTRVVNNQPYVPLSAYAVASIIKGGRDEGGWCGLSAKFAREVGIPSQQFWPQGNRSLSLDRPEMRANAALHKVTEDWVDLTRDVYDQNLTFQQVMSCLLSRVPCAVDFNWWGHSVCGCDPVEVEPGSFGIRIWNSWSDSWGDRGMGVLRGNKAIPNGAVALRVSGASAA